MHDARVNFAQATPEVVTTAVTAAASKPEWWQSALTPLGYVIAALIAGGFAFRIARKTPHENLKALVEIRQTLSEGDVNLDENGVLAAAIGHELDKIDRLTTAREKGFWEYTRTASRDAFSPSEKLMFLFLGIMVILTIYSIVASIGTAIIN